MMLKKTLSRRAANSSRKAALVLMDHSLLLFGFVWLGTVKQETFRGLHTNEAYAAVNNVNLPDAETLSAP